MNQLIPFLFTKAYVRKKYICQDSAPDGVIECYIVAACVHLNEAVKLMVMTNEGAMFCYVPVNAICFKKNAVELPLNETCRWDCMADKGEIILLPFIKDVSAEWITRSGVRRTGTYVCSLHFEEGADWMRLPEQAKIFHFIEGDDANLHVIVNNQTRWRHGAVVDLSDQMTCIPEANQNIYRCED